MKISVSPEHLQEKAGAEGSTCPGEEAGISAHALQTRGILEGKLFCSAYTGQQINSRGWMGGCFPC